MLYSGLAECDAAVILVNRRALASDWVFREATMLLWRRALGDHVPAVPVLIGDVTDAELRASRLAELAALQTTRTVAQSVADMPEAVDDVLRRFGDVPLVGSEPTPMVRWVRDVALCLHDLPRDYQVGLARTRWGWRADCTSASRT